MTPSSPLSETLINKAQATLEELFVNAIASNILRQFKGTFSMPSLAFNQRGKIAGSAVLQKNLIKLNAKLFAQNTDYFLSHIIAHELAHIMVYQLYGLRVKPHGREWKKIMLEAFKLAPEVTHSMDTKDVTLRTFMYKCTCQTVALSVIRHNKVVRGKQTYICRRCGESLIAV